MSVIQSSPPARPTAFIVAVIVIGSASAGGIAYLGLSGRLGGTFPGNLYPQGTPACEGKGVPGNHTFTFVAGVGGGYDFNGTSPGPCAQIVVMSWVTVIFQVASDANVNHSWVLIPAAASSSALPAFPNAGFSNATRFTGIAPGASATFLFHATIVGSYEYICEVSGHRDLGMWGLFTVTASSTTVSLDSVAGPSHPQGISMFSDSAWSPGKAAAIVRLPELS